MSLLAAQGSNAFVVSTDFCQNNVSTGSSKVLEEKTLQLMINEKVLSRALD